MTTGHLPLERLSDFADGELAPEVAAEVQRHLADCVACRSTFRRLQGLLERAEALTPSIDPPPRTWVAIRDQIVLDAGRIPSPRRRRARVWGLRAAAAVLLVAGSSAVTVIALRSRDRAVADGGSTATAAAPATVVAVERSYVDVVDELTATLATQRAALAPETIATLERTLRVIDDAITEARAALAADPTNDAIRDVLTANYEQKVELLRRASELPART